MANGFFSITARTLGPSYPDLTFGFPDSTVLAPAAALLDPNNDFNIGSSSPFSGGVFTDVPAGTNILLATLTLTASAATPLGTYTITPTDGPIVSSSVGPTDYPMVASFTIVVGQLLTVSKTGTGTGTVADTAGSAINCGAVCSDIVPGSATLTAVAAPGSTFTGWTSGPCIGTTTSPCVVPVVAATTVNAQFDLLPQVLTVTVTGAGTGTVTSVVAPPINCPGTCTQTYPANTVVTLTATPTGTSSFTGWSGGVPACSGTGACTVTMNQAQNVTATFGLQTFNLTVTKNGFGTGTVTSAPAGIACGATCTFGFQANTVVTLTAVADPGKTFTSWSGGGCSGSGTCVVTITAATAVTATFGDTQAPTTTITGMPTNPSNVANPQFTFTADESPVTFTCKLDTGAPFTCVSPTTVSVTNGPHTFTVFATDPAGNVGAPVSYSWVGAGIIIVVNSVIPTLNEWMLVLLALILGSAGILASRRKN